MNGRPNRLPNVWHQMAECGGGIKGLAREFEVHRNTIVSWSKGAVPHPLVARHVNRWARQHGCNEPFASV